MKKEKKRHFHNHNHEHNFKDESLKNLIISFILNFSFVIIEIIGGLATNSFAILADAFHDFGDSIAILIAIILQKMSHKEKTEEYPFGFRRLKLIAALLTSIVLVIGSIFIIIKAFERIANPEVINSQVVFIIAIFGIFVNGYSVIKLMKSNAILDRSVMLHLLDDVLGWAAVLVSSIIIYFTDWYFLDPLLSLLVVSFILFNAIKNIITICKQVLIAKPISVSIDEVREEIISVYGDCITNILFYSIDENINALNLDLSIKDEGKEKFIELKNKLEKMNIEYFYINFDKN